MKISISILILALFLMGGFIQPAFAGKCTGNPGCTACSNGKYFKNGGILQTVLRRMAAH